MELNVWPHIPCVARSTGTTWTIQSVSHQCGSASMDGWVSVAPQNEPVACVSCVVGAGFVIASPSPRHPYQNEFLLSIINTKSFPDAVLPSCRFIAGCNVIARCFVPASLHGKMYFKRIHYLSFIFWTYNFF